MSRVFIGVGSNEGDRLAHISRAMRTLADVAGVRLMQMATIIETEPVGLPAPRPLSGIYYVYALRCEGNSIYIGQTRDLTRRWQDHLDGRIDWTKRHAPIEIAHFEVVSTREDAVILEKQWKTGYGRTRVRRLIQSGRARQAGGPPQEPYLNTVVELDTTLSPIEVLGILQEIERGMGRKPSSQRWGPRPIDLDILLYEGRVIQEPQLSIPHPRMHERRFVLEPLAQLAPDVVHPALHQTIAELLAQLPAGTVT